MTKLKSTKLDFFRASFLWNWSVNQVLCKRCINLKARSRLMNKGVVVSVARQLFLPFAVLLSLILSPLHLLHLSTRRQTQTICGAEWFTLLISLPPLCFPTNSSFLIFHASPRKCSLPPNSSQQTCLVSQQCLLTPSPSPPSLVLFGAWVFPRHNSGRSSP